MGSYIYVMQVKHIMYGFANIHYHLLNKELRVNQEIIKSLVCCGSINLTR